MTSQQAEGVFICIEGLDGSGKTTQAKRLVRSLRRRGFDTVYTTEPSRGRVGKLIRSFILNRERRVPTALEALLFAADRIDHVENEVKPLLKLGKIVVCDRYVYSSLAYQGVAGIDLQWIEQINRFALKPHIALLIDAPPDAVLKRLRRKRTVMETERNQARVRDVYLKLAREQHLTLVDGDKPVGEVARNILELVVGLLKTEL